MPTNAALDRLDRQPHADDAGRADENASARRSRPPSPRRRPSADADATPSGPVATLLYLLLATIARSAPPRIVSRPRTTGAPGNWFRVKTAAAAASTSLTNSARSFAAGLRPQFRLAQRNPRGKTAVVVKIHTCSGCGRGTGSAIRYTYHVRHGFRRGVRALAPRRRKSDRAGRRRRRSQSDLREGRQLDRDARCATSVATSRRASPTS